MKEIGVYGGLDVGNGYLKAGLRGSLKPNVKNIQFTDEDKVSIPSGASVVTRPNALPKADDEAQGFTADMEEFYNSLDVSFTTKLIGDQYRRLFGTSALSADSSSVETFDIVGNTSKSEQSLSAAIILGIVSAKALRDWVQANGSLPDEQLHVQAHVGLALPINEYMRHRDRYVSDLKGTDHLVTFHNFETPVSFKVTFETVAVLPEGYAAQFAIGEMGKPLINALLKDVRSRGMALEGVEAEDVLAARDIIGIDIGEGTTNFLVISDGKFNAEASQTFPQGYGTVLESALKAMSDSPDFTHSFLTRKHLADYLLREPSALKRQQYQRVQQFVESEKDFFAKQLTQYFGRVLSAVGSMTEVIYVYGGGSGPMQELLYPLLRARVAEFSSAGEIPVFYLDAAYSRNLNRVGLSVVAAQKFKGVKG